MISTNTSKVKASKSPRDTESERKSRNFEKGDGEVDRDSIDGSLSKRPQSGSVSNLRQKDSKIRPRNRDDFRMARGGAVEKRGSFRGRGVFTRRSDRDVDSGYNSRIIKGGPDGSSGTYKQNVDSKNRDLGSVAPEDCRISKLLRRLCREDEPDKFLILCKQLQDALSVPDNVHYIRRSMDQILESLLNCVHNGPGSLSRTQAAKCIGHVGYNLDSDFKRFADWIFSVYRSEKSNDVRCLLLKALQETLELEAENSKLKELVSLLMGPMQVTLESTDLPDLFVASVEVIMSLAELQPSSLMDHFRDTVDILVGWLIDSSQTAQMTHYAAGSLHRLAPFWVEEINFSITLLGHFLEDMEAYGEDFLKSLNPSEIEIDEKEAKPPSTEDCMFKVEAFIKTVNAVTKALGPYLSPNNSSCVNWSFFGDCLAKMLRTVRLVLDVRLNEDLIITANECVWLLLSHLQTKTTPAHDELYNMFTFLLNKTHMLGDLTICSIVHLIAKTVREVSANLPLQLVQDLLGPKSPILQLRFASSSSINNSVLILYHALLNLKNIPLLQEAYRYVLGDLEVAYKVLVPSVDVLCQMNPSTEVTYTRREAEVVVFFQLKALADLANASNSIIGMWALKPSMLDLLAIHLKPAEVCGYPGLHFTLLYLLHSHCSKYNHFISSSALVQVGSGVRKSNFVAGLSSNISVDGSVNSPTSSHLSNVLTLLRNTLNQECSVETDLLVLSWIRGILTQASSYLSTLLDTVEFQSVVKAVIKKGQLSSRNERVLLSICTTLQNLLSSKNNFQLSLLTSVFELCLIHINATSESVVTAFSHLMATLPWNVSLSTLARMNLSKDSHDFSDSIPERLRWAHSSQLAHSTTGEMTQQDFRQFMGYLLQGVEQPPNWLLEIFSSCWRCFESSERSGSDSKSIDYTSSDKNMSEVALFCKPVLLHWATWSAAQLCVTSRLRTPLGKPQDTFTTIEGNISGLARDGGNSSCWDIHRVRLLLEFVEHLEKVMHNASCGTAKAFAEPPKPARTFFHTNRTTCLEWLSRVRFGVAVVALRAGQAAGAVRHGQALLQVYQLNGKQHPDLERAVMCLACALCRLGEWESISGLYSWCQREMGVKLPALKVFSEHASGQLERAAEGYRRLLESDAYDYNEGEGNICSKTILSDQLYECYSLLQDWDKITEIKTADKLVQSNGQPLLFSCLSSAQATALAEYEAGQHEAAARLLDWNVGASQTDDGMTTWDTVRLLRKGQIALGNIAIGIAGEVSLPVNETIRNGWLESVERWSNEAHLLLREGVRNSPSELIQEAAVLQYAATGLAGVLSPDKASLLPLATESADLTSVRCGVLNSALWWSEYFERMGFHAQISNTSIDELRILTVRAARKQNNPRLAVRLLARHLGASSASKLEELAQMELSRNAANIPLELHTLSQLAKLTHASDKRDLAISLALHGASNSRGADDPQLRERGARLLLTVAKWLQVDPALASAEETGLAIAQLMNRPITPIGDFVDVKNCILLNLSDTQVVPGPDGTVGQVLRLAVEQCPQLAKSWAQLAAWSYRTGKTVDSVTEPGSQLSAADRASVQAMLPIDTTAADLDSVLAILGQTRTLPDEEDIDMGSVNTSEMMESELRKVSALRHAPSETLTGLVGVWREAQQRVFGCYQLSAIAYFKFLQLCGEQEKYVESCATVTAALRLLRLVVKHALELQSVLEAGLAATPTAPWKAIIPQLFSRLGHPEPYVRRRVAELLCRLAGDSAHLITFPAVVGAASGGARLRHMPLPSSGGILFKKLLSPVEGEGERESLEDDDDEEDDEEEEEEGSAGGQAILKNCFLAMVDTLSKQAPEAISQVQKFVSELRRITLLWDELWLGTLALHQSEIDRKSKDLVAEISRVNENVSLNGTERAKIISEKYRIILKPILFILEQLHAITSVTPETPNEVWFQKEFGDVIEKTLQRLKDPSFSRHPEDWAQQVKCLQQRLSLNMSKRSVKKMADVSPVLASMKDTDIAMPGVASQDGRVVTVSAVHNHITVLPSKTKPKKLRFYGSDGKVYTFLFKGLEDLHLDERIMQLLHIANTMLRMQGSENTYQARHYSVIPLGPRSGLISWVDDVTPLFALYKRWLEREASAQAMKNGLTVAPVLRPSTLFYQKLAPKLQEKKIAIENRKEWPLPVLRQVLQELMAETPSHLLAKELWCHRANAGAWWQSSRTYSRSVAVMSVIGYLIGLGDRHLDNVMVDLYTGEVVHIDYNVCFEKGKSLRVPEKVPFRMTPNIEAALGVTGVEGTFRLACEHVLKVMKKGKETFLTLLEAFVYDPLIDWTTGNEPGYAGAVYGGGQAIALATKQSLKELEREVTRTMFSIRIQEMRSSWHGNRSSIEEALSELMTHLNSWDENCSRIKSVQEMLQDCHSLLALVKEAEVQISSRSHPLYSLPVRYSNHCQARDALQVARGKLRDRLLESREQIQVYKAALNIVRGPQLSQLTVSLDQEEYLVFDLVKEFLQNAGQSQMVFQCNQSESEMSDLALKQARVLRLCVEILGHYGAVAGLFPASYVNKHRILCYERWASLLLKDLTTTKCQQVVAEFGTNFSPQVNGVNQQQQQIVNFAVGLHNSLTEANIRLQKSYSMLRGENCAEVATALDKACTDAEAALKKLRMSDPGVPNVLESVAITALAALNKRFLIREAAAASAGDNLVDLITRDGEWFLDDLCLSGAIVVKMSSLLQAPEAGSQINVALECLSSIHGIYRGLQDLIKNFTSIILPEAVVALQTQEPSVLTMVNELSLVIESAPDSLQDLIDKLDVHLSCLAIGVDSPHSNVKQVVSELRSKLEQLMQQSTKPRSKDSDDSDSDCESSDADKAMSAGQMLLMGFNGLFEKIQLDSHALAHKLVNISVPSCWKSIDFLREAKTRKFEESTRSVLEDVFLLKRLHTMQEFFWLCSTVGKNFRGEATAGPIMMMDEDRLSKPVRRFAADYVSRQLLGVMSHTLGVALCLLLQRAGLNVTGEVELRDIGAESKVPMEELCRKAMERCCGPRNSVLGQVSSLVSTLEANWRRREVHRALKVTLDLQSATVQRIQMALTTHHWLHDSVLQGVPGLSPPPFNRSLMLCDLERHSASLEMLQPRIVEARKRQEALVVGVEQRLRWAAGANPALSEVLSAFSQAVASLEERIKHEQRVAALLASTCKAILHYEMMRAPHFSEGLQQDTAFLQLVDKCERSCNLAREIGETVSPAEESLVRMSPLNGPIDRAWLLNAETVISGKIKNLQHEMTTVQESIVSCRNSVKDELKSMRPILYTHSSLMSDVRVYMKSMAKFEECALSGLGDYLVRYRAYFDKLVSLTRLFVGEEVDSIQVSDVIEQVQLLIDNTGAIFGDLVGFAEPIGGVPTEVKDSVGRKRPPLLRQDSVCMSPRKGVETGEKEPARDPHTGKALQERNAFAMNVWRRVRLKLEGRDPDPSRRATTAEQVDFIIKEATNLDNLALLYEGWTPWV